jgi:guanine deaminase
MSDTNEIPKQYMRRAVELARYAVDNNLGGPFGAVVVRNGIIIGEGYNCVTSTNDPTGHAEIVAIRNACRYLGGFQLESCEIYSSCEPCPMCLGAIYWARPSKLYYGATRYDAATAGFDDSFIYDELKYPPEKRNIPAIFLDDPEAARIFNSWVAKEDKITY